jgi:WD40 repeat protein
MVTTRFFQPVLWLTAFFCTEILTAQVISENKTLIKLPETIYSLAYAPDGKTFACITSPSVQIREAGTGRFMADFKGHTDVLTSMAYSPDGRFLLTGSQDKSLKLWSITTGTIVRTIANAHDAYVYVVAYSPDGKKIASGSYDGTVKVWDAMNYTLLHQFKVGAEPIYSLTFANNNYILAGSTQGVVKQYSMGTRLLLSPLNGLHASDVTQIVYSKNGRRLATGTRKGEIKVWNTTDWKLLWTQPTGDLGIVQLAFSADDARLISYNNPDWTWMVRNVADGKLLEKTKTDIFINDFALSPDRHSMIAAYNDATIRLLEVQTDDENKVVPPPSPVVVYWNTKNNNTYSNSNQSISACAISEGMLQVYFNGTLLRGQGVVKAENCINGIKQNVVLKEGVNRAYVTFTNRWGVVSKSDELILHLKTEQPETNLPPSPAGNTTNTEKRLALIIGNSQYEHGTSLPNPVNDARSMRDVLKNLGFDVISVENQTKKQMDETIRQFGTKLKDYDIGLFFYAGHGIEVDGVNFMLPTDVPQQMAKEDIPNDCVNTDWLQQKMAAAGAFNKTNIVILDACRNNPFRNWRTYGEDIWVTPKNVPTGLITAFASSQGESASDGIGKNGLYTSVLLKHIKTQGITIEEVFKRVRIELLQKGGQVPAETTKLTKDFYFKR